MFDMFAKHRQLSENLQQPKYSGQDHNKSVRFYPVVAFHAQMTAVGFLPYTSMGCML